MAIKPIQWRVKGLLPTTGIAAIFGPSGSGKSFLAKDLGACIALGQDWFGHRTSACHVTYVMLEGEGGLRNRVEAWETHNGKSLPSGFQALAQAFRLTEAQDVEDLAAILPKGGVVIIDTLNRAADVGVQLCGARGYSKDTVLEWIYRYARCAKLVDGASEVHKMVLARSLAKEGNEFWSWG